MSLKQVIVMRHDLGMRRGKQIAQGAHASMAFMKDKLMTGEPFTLVEQAWMAGEEAKICCRVDSEAELFEVQQKAIDARLQVCVVYDLGKTEFHGQSTPTCLAVGPDESDKINKVTGELKLL
jgi:PTH2 family peptidyl-tRNA hydrolase